MQPNIINLDVDYLNDATTTAEAYSREDEFLNRTVYHGANHAPELRDTLTLYRNRATVNGNFKGVTKSSLKLTLDAEVPGVDSSTTLTAPCIAECTFSFPVGTSAAEQLKVRQRMIAALDNDSIMVKLNQTGSI